MASPFSALWSVELSEEFIEGLPFNILYIVHSVYEMQTDDGGIFMLHKDTGVPSNFPMAYQDIIEEAFQIDYEGLQFAGEDSRGTILVREGVGVARTLYRSP